MPATLITGKERVRLRLLIEARGTDAAGHAYEHRASGRAPHCGMLHERGRPEAADSSPSSRAAFSRDDMASRLNFKVSVKRVEQRSRSHSKSAR